jgi:ABC-type sugar transport system permease subunit
VLLGFGLALLINRRFRGHSFWTTIILLPMMLSPAVVGNFWTFCSAADRTVQLRGACSPASTPSRSR